MESLVVFNLTNQNVTFTLEQLYTEDDLLEKNYYHRRRIMRKRVPVTLKPAHSLDLVQFSGLTIKDIKSSTDYLHVVNYPNRIKVMFDSSRAEFETVASKLLEELKSEDSETPDPVDAAADVITEYAIEAETSIDPVVADDLITEEEVAVDLTTSKKPKKKGRPKKSK
jgi:hypothetical protein